MITCASTQLMRWCICIRIQYYSGLITVAVLSQIIGLAYERQCCYKEPIFEVIVFKLFTKVLPIAVVNEPVTLTL